MPEIHAAGVRLHYQATGCESGPVLLLGNSLGSDLHMWDKLLPPLEPRYRVVRFDTRGHGKSSVPPGPYSIEDLGGDVLALLDALEVPSANFCGISLGGQVGMWLGIHAPKRIERMILANTGARIGSEEMWDQRVDTVHKSGMEELAKTTLTRWFTDGYREKHPDEMHQIRNMIAGTDAAGYIACCSALRETDLTNEIAGISCPSLVIVGRHDPATPPETGLAVHKAIRGSKLVELDASHLSAWERAGEFGAELNAFLEAGGRRNG